MSSDKGDDDSDSTGIGGLRPPRRPAPAEEPPPPDDHTHVGAPPRPPMPKVEKPAPAADEPAADTGVRAVPPPKPPAPAAREASPPPAPPSAEEEIGTAIFERPKVSLTRLAPSERFGVVPLQDGVYKIGRSSSCDVPLFSAASSRDHARLRREPHGWVIEPQPGKTVLVNGASTSQATALGRRARIRLGEDELLFVDESAAAAPPGISETAAPPPQRRGLAIAVAAAVLAVVAAWVWLSR